MKRKNSLASSGWRGANVHPEQNVSGRATTPEAARVPFGRGQQIEIKRVCQGCFKEVADFLAPDSRDGPPISVALGGLAGPSAR